MKLKRAKTTVIVLTIAGLAFIVAVLVFVFIPSLKEIRGLAMKIGAAHAELDAQYANRRNLLSSIDKAASAREIMEDLTPQFVPLGKELDFITSIEELAAQDGVEERVTLKPVQGGKPAQELKESFELIVSGDYLNVMRMLTDIERLPTLVIFEAVQIRPNAGTGPENPSFLSVTLKGSLVAPPVAL